MKTPGHPETFDYAEAVAAIVMQLTREGITAWNGDATYCIAHMLKAQFDRWDKLRALRASAPVSPKETDNEHHTT